MDDLVQIFGAMLILAGFVLAQFGRLDERSWTYLLLNLVGSVILALLAYGDRRLGFLLLEGAWFIITLAAITAKLSGRVPPTAH